MGKESFSGDEGMVRLMSLLLEGRTLTVKTIAQELDVKEAAARRKLRALQTLPRAVSLRVGKDEAVRLPEVLPLPTITSSDAAAACLASSFGSALRETALGARLRKLIDGVVSRSRTYCDAKDRDRKFWFVVRGGERGLARGSDRLDTVLDAILASRTLRFSYRHFDGEKETVSAAPLTLAVYEHQFYVICRKDKPPFFYPFRFSRMSRIAMRGEFSYPSETEYDPVSVFRDSFGIFIGLDGQPVDVRIRLDEKWRSHVESHRWHESQQSSVNPDGSVGVTVHVRICPEVRRWINWFGSEAEVIEPLSLRAEIHDDLQAAARRYRRSPGNAR